MTKILSRLQQLIHNRGFIRSADIVTGWVLSRIIPTNAYLFLWSFDAWHRYYTARTLIGPEKKSTRLLDVGGGSGGFARYLVKCGTLQDNRDVVIVDPCADLATAASKKGNSIVRASGMELPFHDFSIDSTVSLHALEHVEPSDRQRFLFELMRVTRQRIVIVCPEGDHSEKMSRDVCAFCRRYGKTLDPFALEHLENGVPRVTDILQSFGNDWHLSWFPIKNYWLDSLYFKFVHLDVPLVRYLVFLFLAVTMFLYRHVPPSTEVAVLAVRR